MTKPMDLARFEALVAAYGAMPDQWPEEERAAAQAFADHDPRAATLLAEADAIDGLLFAHRVADPSRTLRAIVIESAPRRRGLARRMRMCGAGLAAAFAACAGVLAGSAATVALAPATTHLLLYEHDEVASYDEALEENGS